VLAADLLGFYRLYTPAVMPKSTRGRKRPLEPKRRKLSVMVLHRIEDTMELWSSVDAYKVKLAAAIGERYSPRLRPGEELPDYALALELAVRDVQAALARLMQLDDEADHASVQCDLLRLERDRLVREEVYPAAVSVRGSIDLAFGPRHGFHVHGMKGRTRRRASALEEQVGRAVRRLTHPDLKLPPPKNAYSNVDREGWIRQLEPLYRRFRELHREVVRSSERTVPRLIGEEQRAMASFDAAYQDALRLVTAAFKAARFDAKAAKNLKPYYQRRRLSRRAEKKRQTRAASAVAEQTPKPARFGKDTDRVEIPKPVAEWLEAQRLFGT
jgi:hypothetical protein